MLKGADVDVREYRDTLLDITVLLRRVIDHLQLPLADTARPLIPPRWMEFFLGFSRTTSIEKPQTEGINAGRPRGLQEKSKMNPFPFPAPANPDQ